MAEENSAAPAGSFSVSSNGTASGTPSLVQSTATEPSTNESTVHPLPTFGTDGNVPFTTDTAGLDPARAAAAKFVDHNRLAAMNAPGHSKVAQMFKEAQSFALGVGDRPSWLTTQAGEEVPAIAHGSTDAEVKAGFGRDMPELLSKGIENNLVDKPAAVRDAQAATELAVLHGMERGEAGYLSGVFHAMSLGAEELRSAMTIAAHHSRTPNDAGQKGLQQLSAAEQQDYHNESVRAFGSVEKHAAAVADARAYIEALSPGTVAGLEKSKIGQSSLMFDPRIISMFAARWRAMNGRR